jgi:hypothetical protein
MKSRSLVLTACALVIVLGALCAPLSAGEDTAVSAAGPCCFENPRYSGTCQVTPGEDETCGDVLSYLNNPNSVGKDYCGNTTIRGGWTQVACEDDASMSVCTGGGESSDRD